MGEIKRAGRCRVDDSDTAVTIIFNAMLHPSCKAVARDPSAGRMRPRFLLVDPQLKVSYVKIKEQVELTGVPVRLHNESSYTEAIAAAHEPIHRRATYYDGFVQGPTAALVKEILPLEKEEIWKASLYDLPPERELQDRRYAGLLIIEDVSKQPITMIGRGPIHAFSCAEAIFATMLSPVDAKQGGGSPCNAGVPRRPGLLLLDEGIGSSHKLLKDALLWSEVRVKVHNARSNLCGNMGCYKVDVPEDLLDCPCERISYCSREYQLVHHVIHKHNCPWYEEKKKKEKEGKTSKND